MGKEPIVSRDEYEAQTEKLYAGIGRVTVEAEHLNHVMCRCGEMILQVKGLDHRFAQTALNGHNLESMRRLWESLVKQINRDDDFAQDLITNLSKRIDNVIQRRNNVVHSQWYIGYGNENTERYDEAINFKARRAIGRGQQGGLKFSSLKSNTEGFQEIISELVELTGLVRRLDVCIHMKAREPDKGSLKANFHYDDTGILRAGRAPESEGKPAPGPEQAV